MASSLYTLSLSRAPSSLCQLETFTFIADTVNMDTSARSPTPNPFTSHRAWGPAIVPITHALPSPLGLLFSRHRHSTLPQTLSRAPTRTLTRTLLSLSHTSSSPASSVPPLLPLMSAHPNPAASAASQRPSKKVSPSQLREVFDDLCSRFIVNLPAEEYESFERLFFAIESAHWFYDDFYRENQPSLPRLPLKQFAARLFDHTAFLASYRHDVDRLTAQFQSYKQEVPTCGAALLNPAMDKVVLVRGWGRDARWSFPKGKLAKDETELQCAIREVEEEIGFDITHLVSDSTFYIDSYTSGRCSRIFCVPNVPEDTVFATQTRKEISAIDWVSIASLPDTPKSARNHNKAVVPKDGTMNAGDKPPRILFAQQSLVPFTKRLRSWIKRHRAAIVDLPSVVSDNMSMSSTMLPTPALQADVPYSPPPPVPPPAELEPLPAGALSVQEIEASLPQQTRSDGPRKRGSRGKARGGGGGGGGNGADGKGSSSRKARKETAEAQRNRATFGDFGGATMSDIDRDNLFRQYVLETDSIVAAKGLTEEFWPVPYITSKDFTEQEKRAAENARRDRVLKSSHVPQNGITEEQEKDMGKVHQVKSARKPPDDSKAKVCSTAIDLFAFDREAILASMLHKDQR